MEHYFVGTFFFFFFFFFFLKNVRHKKEKRRCAVDMGGTSGFVIIVPYSPITYIDSITIPYFTQGLKGGCGEKWVKVRHISKEIKKKQF